MIQQLSNDMTGSSVAAVTGSGTTTITTSYVSLKNRTGVVWLLSLGTANAGNIITVQQYDGTTVTNVKTVTPAADGDLQQIELAFPDQRLGDQARLSIARGAATTISQVFALEYGGRVSPIDAGTTKKTVVVGPAAV